MLTGEDLRAIGRIVDTKIDGVLKVVEAHKAEAKTDFEDLLEAVNKGFQNVQDTLGADVAGLKTDVAGLKKEMAEVKAEMVTKDYLDRRLGVTNGRLASLVNILEKKKVITEDDKRYIYQ